MLDLRRHGIKVAVLLPGSVATEFGAGRGADEDWRIAPEDLAALVLHLLSYPERTLPSLVEVRPTRPGEVTRSRGKGQERSSAPGRRLQIILIGGAARSTPGPVGASTP